MKKENTKTLSTGATRSPVKEAFHLICPELERRVSLICAEGLENYPFSDIKEAEITTAAKGMPLDNLIKHAKRHLNLWLGGNREEDHLAKVSWAIQQIMHQESHCQHIKIFLNKENQNKVI